MNDIKLDYNTRQGDTCFLSSCANFLSFLGWDIYDYEIFFDGEGLKFSPAFDDGENNLLGLWINTLDIVKRFLQKYNMSVIKCKFAKSRSEVVEKVFYYLSTKQPVIAHVKTMNLRYSPIFSQANSTHTVVVYGIDDSGFYLSDSFIPTEPSTLFAGRIDRKEFLSAWEANDWAEYRFIYSTLPSSRYSNHEFKRLFVDNLKQYLHNELNGHLLFHKFSNWVLSLQNLIVERRIKASPKMISFTLHYYGVLFSRIFILRAVQRLLPSNEGELNEIDYVIHEWKRIELMLIKSFLKPKIISPTCHRLDLLINREEHLFQNLLELLETRSIL